MEVEGRGEESAGGGDGLDYSDCLHQEMTGGMEEVSLRKSFQHHVGGH